MLTFLRKIRKAIGIHQHAVRKIVFLVLVSSILIFSSCSGEGQLVEDVGKEHPYLIGRWSGEGRFMDKDLEKEIGSVEIEVKIEDGNQISASIGDAEMQDIEIKIADFGFSIRGILDSPVKAGHELDKDHAIILLVLDDENSTKSEANFHLKSNFTFDFGMRVGGVTLIKKPI